jgi:hypothetical protein
MKIDVHHTKGDPERLFENYQIDQYLLDRYKVMYTYPLEAI